jgi:hypothetical protein
MRKILFNNSQTYPTGNTFDLFRLSHAKEVVDVCPNTLRSFNREGLPFYRMGKAVFVSKAELDAFIRTHSEKTRE